MAQLTPYPLPYRPDVIGAASLGSERQPCRPSPSASYAAWLASDVAPRLRAGQPLRRCIGRRFPDRSCGEG